MQHAEHNAPYRLGRYELIGKIASGGMATVYRGRKSGLGGFEREFAIKVVHPHLAAVEGFTERFLDEARVASRVHHPNVCAVIDIDADRGYQFLVLELIDGVTVRQSQVWGDGDPLAPEEAARIVADAARGLEALHSVTDEDGSPLDVVHRDVTPHNVMVDAEGRAVLIDLGLANARDKLGHTQTGVLIGKLPYMSPEQSRVEALDHRSDIFSLGTVLFELVAGELPFGEDHTPGTLERLRRCDTPTVVARLEDLGVPGWLRDIISRCLQPDPSARFARAQDLAQALEAEMHMRGFEQADIRARIAVRVRDTQSAIGQEEPAGDLPVPIHVGDDRSSGRGLLASAQTEGAIGEIERSGDSLTAGALPAAAPPTAPWWRGPLALVAGSFAAVMLLAGASYALGLDAGGMWRGESQPFPAAADDPSMGALERIDKVRAGRAAPGVTGGAGDVRSGRRAGGGAAPLAPDELLADEFDTSGTFDTDGDSDGEDTDGTSADADAEPAAPSRQRKRKRRDPQAPVLRKNPYTDGTDGPSALMPSSSLGLFVALSLLGPPTNGDDGAVAEGPSSAPDTATEAPAVSEARRRRALAGAAFREGVAAFEREDYETSIAAFRAADDLVSHPHTRFNLGLSLVAADRPIQAWRVLRSVEVQTNDDAERDEVRLELHRLEQRVAVLTVRAPAGARLCLDGKRVQADHLGDFTTAVWPGAHRLGVDGTAVDVTLAAGAPTTLNLDQTAALVAERPHRLTKPLVGVAAGAAVASVTLGIASLAVPDRRTGTGLGAGAVVTAALAGGAGIAALVINRRGAADDRPGEDGPDTPPVGDDASAAENEGATLPATVEPGCPPPPQPMGGSSDGEPQRSKPAGEVKTEAGDGGSAAS